MKQLPRRKTIRLRGFNYSNAGYYFVTICTFQKMDMFGNIVNGKMILNEYGKIVKNIWNLLPKYFPVLLNKFQIMPNHIHYIINIVGAGSSRPIHPSSRPDVHQGSPRKTLGQIVAFFKYQSTKQINESGARTAPLQNKMKFKKIFQRNYYEHIIRNEREFYAIRQYIQNNPVNWDKDSENPKNLHLAICKQKV